MHDYKSRFIIRPISKKGITFYIVLNCFFPLNVPFRGNGHLALLTYVSHKINWYFVSCNNLLLRASLLAQSVKESACNAGDPGSNPGLRRILGRIPGLGRSLEKEMATHSRIRAWRIPWTEELGRLQSMGSQELDMT